MNGDTPSDSEERSDFNPSQSISTLADLQVKAYENRVRERLLAKYPTPTSGRSQKTGERDREACSDLCSGKNSPAGRSIGWTPTEITDREEIVCNPREWNHS